MKTIASFFIILFIFVNLAGFSQDVIYKTDGSREEAKVVLVGDKEIQYKKFSNLDGPVYTISKASVLLITYENGEYDMITSKPATPEVQKVDMRKDFTRNLLDYHVFDVFYGDIAFSYERIVGTGIMGIHIPLGFGYAYNLDYFEGNDEWVKNLVYSGVGVYFYPGGQGAWRYFVGPKFLVGYGKQTYWVYDYNENGNYVDQEETTEGTYMKYMVDNGIRFTPIRNFSVAAVLSVGIRFFPAAGEYTNTVMPTGHFGMNVSYRF